MAIRIWALPYPQNPLQFFIDRCKSLAISELEVRQIRSPRRDARLVDLRMIVAQEMRAAGFTLKEIGRCLNRDHTTIINLLRRYENNVTPGDKNRPSDAPVL